MLDEEIISLNRMKLFARSSDLSVVIAKDMNIVVNLVEKQQKEIEELKNGQIDFWISDKEIEERIRNKFVSNDKIKAKIEDLEKEQEDNRKDLYNAVNNLNFSKIDIISNRIFVNMLIKDILRSLLEKE